MNIGLVKHGTLSKKKQIYWEVQLFALTRSLADGLTLFKFNNFLLVFQQFFKNIANPKICISD